MNTNKVNAARKAVNNAFQNPSPQAMNKAHQMLNELKVDFDHRGNVKTGENYMTSRDGVFAAGDMRRGQSLIVWAIAEGRRAAHKIDRHLMGESFLPDL